jgi:FimV-like protein
MCMCPILVALICMCLGAVRDAADHYTTQHGDTLWDIAKRYVQDDTTTIDEMMRKLFDANPNAFINHDMDLLKIGYTLRIPAQEERRMPRPPPSTGDPRLANTSAEPTSLATDTPPVAAVEKVVAEDVARLQSELTLTQEQASRQHAENEALRNRVEALEARVTKLGEIASTPGAVDRDRTTVTPAHPPSRTAAWLTIPNVTMMMSLMIVLGLAAIWYWGRRASSTTVPTLTEPAFAAQPPTEVTGPLAFGLSDLHVETEGPDETKEVIAANLDAGLDAETVSVTPLAHLMIDVDDLELESSQTAAERPDSPSSVSISPKADPGSPPKAC